MKSISNRQKRLFATINVAFALTMEWIKEWIFGDTNNDKIIEDLKKADEENREFIKEQISIANQSLHIQKEAFKKIVLRINKIHTNLALLEKINIQNQNRFTLYNIMQETMIVLINHYQLIDSLTKIFSEERPLNFIDFIGEETFKKNLLTIDKKLGEAEALPINIVNTSALEMLHIVDTSLSMDNTNIYIKISLPIVQQTSFQHFRLIPFPVVVNHSMQVVTDIAQNIFYDVHNNEFFLPTYSDMLDCKKVSTNIKICSSLNPIYKVHSCESAALVFNNTKNCKFTETASHNHLIRLGLDTFMIVPFVDVQVNIMCYNGTSVSQFVSKIKIVQVEPGCMVENDDFRFEIGLSKYENLTVPIFDDWNIEFTNSSDMNFSVFDEYVNIEASEFEFGNLSEMLLELLSNASRTEKDRKMSQHNEMGLILMLAISLIVFILIRIGCIILRLHN